MYVKQKVEKIHRFMCRQVCNNFTESYGDLLARLSWSPLWLINLQRLLFCFINITMVCLIFHRMFLFYQMLGGVPEFTTRVLLI